jgi:hypothetical protein
MATELSRRERNPGSRRSYPAAGSGSYENR